jgi:PBSX family phage terminase large subunit
MAGYFIVDECMKYPGNTGIVASANSETLRMATIPKILAILDKLKLEYEYSEYKNRLWFRNGSWLKFQSLAVDDPNALKGSEIGFLLIDETDACKQAYINVLIPRVRKKGTSRKIRLIFNPPPPEHWLESWFDPQDGTEPLGSFFMSNSYENFFLPGDYIERLERLHPPGTPGHKRFVLGMMGVQLDDAVYPEYDVFKHVITKAELESRNYNYVGELYGVDLGFRNPTVMLRGRLTDDDVLVIDGEYFKAGASYDEHAASMKNLYGRGTIFCDHDAQGRHEYLRLGLKMVPAFKDVLTGFEAVRDRLRDERLLIVREECVNLRRELPRYRVGPDGEKPVKKDDHACFTGDHEVLTPGGWVRLDKLEDGVECMSVRGDGSAGCFFEKPLGVIRKPYTGELVHQEIDGATIVATDDHLHAYIDRFGPTPWDWALLKSDSHDARWGAYSVPVVVGIDTTNSRLRVEPQRPLWGVEERVSSHPVYCLTTSTGFFLARREGKIFVAGNCDALRYLVAGLDIQAEHDRQLSSAIYSAFS